MFTNLSIETLRTLSHILLWVAILAGPIIVGGATALRFYLDRELGRRSQSVTDNEVAQLQQRADAARHQADTAREETERLQALTTEAERRLEALRAEVADRRLSPVQRERILSGLQGRKSVAVVVSPMADPEAGAFADDLARVLREAGWETARIRNRITTETGLALGAVSGVRFSPEAELLIAALKDVGVPHRIVEFQDGDASTSPQFKRGFLYLVVEHKPGPTVK
jgi:hypothetical protein